MTVRFPARGSAIFAYSIATIGISLLAVRLSALLAANAIAVADPYSLSGYPCVPNMVERRLIAEQPPTNEATKIGATLEAPSMDLAEAEGLPPSGAR